MSAPGTRFELPLLAGAPAGVGPSPPGGREPECEDGVRFLNLDGTYVVWRPDTALGVVTDLVGVELARQWLHHEHVPDSPSVRTFFRLLRRLGLGGNAPPAAAVEQSLRCKRVFINLTNACNYRCRYCHASSGPREKGELTFDEWVSVMVQLPELNPKGVTFTGGEALIRRDASMIAQALRRVCPSLPLTLNTNGSLLTRESAAEVATTFDRVKVSIDTLPDGDDVRGPGAAEAALRGAKFLLDAGARVEVNVTLTRPVLAGLDDLIDALRPTGIRAVKFNALLLTGSATAAPELQYTTADLIAIIATGGPAGRLLREGVRRYVLSQLGTDDPTTCGVGSYLNVTSNGDVYPCHTLKLPDYWAGNVREQPLRTIWEQAPAFRQVRSLRTELYDGCRTCDFRRVCRGGCRGLAAQSGNVLGLPPDCAERMALYRWFLPQVLPSFPMSPPVASSAVRSTANEVIPS